jgi:predicted  nucleic acid-binding Zn-ribbon protein
MADPGFIERLDGKIGSLQRYEIATRQHILHTQQELARSTADIELELEALKKELGELDAQIHVTVVRVKDAITRFRSVVKKSELVRLQQRIDLWAPEQKITREQFKRMLADEFAS